MPTFCCCCCCSVGGVGSGLVGGLGVGGDGGLGLFESSLSDACGVTFEDDGGETSEDDEPDVPPPDDCDASTSPVCALCSVLRGGGEHDQSREGADGWWAHGGRAAHSMFAGVASMPSWPRKPFTRIGVLNGSVSSAWRKAFSPC